MQRIIDATRRLGRLASGARVGRVNVAARGHVVAASNTDNPDRAA